ncbi:MAG TPA: superoxide dismutase [Actinomycetota bacterium]|nr:superoxide dismutase [Actinomycetota bacterium]
MRWFPRFAIASACVSLLAGTAAAQPFPDVIALPTGFQPEGIAIAGGPTFFVGSIPSGAVYRGELGTGTGDVLVPAQAGRMAIGMAVDRHQRLFVAGGPTGQAYVYDARTGDELAVYQLTTASATFVNDVVVTKDSAWFTDSFQPVLYRVPIGAGGSLAGPGDVEELPLSGDYTHVAGAFNLNGIEATPDGATLLAVQSASGKVFSIDPPTGMADEVELTGGDVAFGDGLLLAGRTLFVVQNQLNQIAVVSLDADLGAGAVTGHLTDPDLDVPTTIAKFGRALYAVNARFGIANPETAEYAIARVAIGP